MAFTNRFAAAGTVSGRMSSRDANMPEKAPRWSPLTMSETCIPAANVADMDTAPRHTVRLAGDESGIAIWLSFMWLRLDVAARDLQLSLFDTLRIWHSGLVDAGRVESMNNAKRARYLHLPEYSPEEGQHLLTAVEGLERLQAGEADFGRAGLLAVLYDLEARFVDCVPPKASFSQVNVFFDACLIHAEASLRLIPRFHLASNSPRQIGGNLADFELIFHDLMTRMPLRYRITHKLRV